MEMDKLTKPLLSELIDKIEVYEAEGVGKNRTQRVVIYYRFVGYFEIPYVQHVPAELTTRQGVAIRYLPELPS